MAVLHPEGGVSLTVWAAQTLNSPLALLIGPEGGFTDQEIDQAIAYGATKVTFGPRVLRTETAGLAALAALQAVLGDLR
jgi:16S rRNA (uracil1498-N3)-methyltransferase